MNFQLEYLDQKKRSSFFELNVSFPLENQLPNCAKSENISCYEQRCMDNHEIKFIAILSDN